MMFHKLFTNKTVQPAPKINRKMLLLGLPSGQRRLKAGRIVEIVKIKIKKQ